MQAAFEREMAAGRGPTIAAAAACAVLLESVAAASVRSAPVGADGAENAGAASSITATPDGVPPPGDAPSRRMDGGDVEELVAALTYALRFDARGKPRRGGGFDFAADLAAEWLAEHLRRSNFVVTRRPPSAPHRAG
jgi:hypothetical protein